MKERHNLPELIDFLRDPMPIFHKIVEDANLRPCTLDELKTLKDREVWTDSTCMLVAVENYSKLRSELGLVD